MTMFASELARRTAEPVVFVVKNAPRLSAEYSKEGNTIAYTRGSQCNEGENKTACHRVQPDGPSETVRLLI